MNHPAVLLLHSLKSDVILLSSPSWRDNVNKQFFIFVFNLCIDTFNEDHLLFYWSCCISISFFSFSYFSDYIRRFRLFLHFENTIHYHFLINKCHIYEWECFGWVVPIDAIQWKFKLYVEAYFLHERVGIRNCLFMLGIQCLFLLKKSFPIISRRDHELGNRSIQIHII